MEALYNQKIFNINNKTMKIVFLISVLIAVCVNYSQAQKLTNYNVYNAHPICRPNVGTNVYEVFDGNDGFVCNNGQVKFYYVFQPQTNQVLSSTSASKIVFIGYGNTAGTVAMNTTYKLYGPFDPGEGYLSLIESNSVSPLAANSTPSASQSVTASVVVDKHYVVEVTGTDADCLGKITLSLPGFSLICPTTRDCESCIPKFQPANGNYVVTGWVKEKDGEAKTSYDQCFMKVIVGAAAPVTVPVSGQIIDGWQRMELSVPGNSVGNFAIELTANTGKECYFDDIRVIPFEGSMVSYVYDPVTMRLIAELDERNYAKIYEYDEEGKLIRVKKETERGIMTIQQNSENTSVKDGY